ncbi:suppressor of fused domain protein [Solihabitans fulvus]|uniref:Suppressor of fused domain protein n=1 Tax=Solihabitans fulvus TaxID=1892852 RepID=A0A5B2WJ40_9PSEU|nr:suppressor of fused domain protein [Solihabitans fulvus]KAA2250712.1 suppressor of fused domain protein [Solihabitans fulvus]
MGWSFVVLQELAKYVIGHGVLLEPGHRLDLRCPVTGHPCVPEAPSTGLTVVAVTTDPELGQIDTPHGMVRFLPVVGATVAEKAEMVASSTAAVLARLATSNPLLVTDPRRA